MSKFSMSRSRAGAAVCAFALLGMLSRFADAQGAPSGAKALRGQLRAAAAAAPQDGAAVSEEVKSQLEQAIDLVVAAAKSSVSEAKTDSEATAKVQQAFEAIQAISQMGKLAADAQTEKLTNALQENVRPAVAEVIARLQMEGKLRQWPSLSEADRASTISNFVAAVKKSGATMTHASLLMRLASMQEMVDQPGPAVDAINELLPEMRKLDEANAGKSIGGRQMKPYAPRLEGIVRRMGLVGKPMELEGKLLDGSTFDWNSYRGKVVLIDFHASWCGPCRAEVPNVLENYRNYHDKGFEVVGVNMDTDPKLAQKYIDDTGAKFPTIYSDDPDATGWEAPLATKYGVTAIPRVILVGKDGNVVSTSARGPKLAQLLQEILGPPANAPAEEKGGT